MTYHEAVSYIEEIPKFTEKHRLSHTRLFLERLGNPGLKRKIIHVAGTNGKGSVCAYMQAILLASGRRTGFFTSPHLLLMNERIRIDNVQISCEDFLDVFLQVKETVDGMAGEGIAHPSYFEFLFGMAMLAFEKKDVEYIILETGLGGRLDATNVVEHPLLTVITSVSLDHTAYLGSTIEEVAAEKAGIIKEGVPVIYDGTSDEASRVIEKRAESLCAECRKLGKNAYEIHEITKKNIAFSRPGAYDRGVLWSINGCGIYQAMNVSLALAAMEQVFPEEARDYQKWQKAVSGVTWEGRMEEILPGVFLDGAHNPGAVEAFADNLEALGEEEPVIVFAAARDKEYRTMIDLLCRRVQAGVYLLTEIPDGRRIEAEELAREFGRCTEREILVEKDPETALRRALAVKGGRCVYCLGSLYLVGEARRILKKIQAEEAE